MAQIYLASLDDKPTPKAIRIALRGLIIKQNPRLDKDKRAEVLAQAYEQAMERINGQKPGLKKLAIQVLSWITCAKRPLTLLELQHALAVEVGEPELDEENFPQIRDMVSVCAGLVTVDEESGIIRLVHYTAQEYFERTQKRWFPNADLDIMMICVTYLSFSVFETGFCRTDKEFENRLGLNSLYDYAAHNWGNHARQVPKCHQGVIDFLEDVKKVEASSQVLMVEKRSWKQRYSQEFPREMTGLHMAAYFGVYEAVTGLLEHWQNVDLNDTNGRTPLSYAAGNGHEAVVKLLLDKGADAEAREGNYGRTPLLWAAVNGHEVVVKLLLDTRRVDVNLMDRDGRTPLWHAAENRHDAVVKVLLGTEGIDSNSKDEYGRTVLLWAAEKGYETIVKMLLAVGSTDLNSKDKDGLTPLIWAIRRGKEAVVELLLSTSRVDANAKDTKYGQSALSWAAWLENQEIVKLLLRKEGLNPDCKDNGGLTPMSWFIMQGQETMVDLLLAQHDMDIKYGSTIRWLRLQAEKNGHDELPNDCEPVMKPLFPEELRWLIRKNGHEASSSDCGVAMKALRLRNGGNTDASREDKHDLNAQLPAVVMEYVGRAMERSDPEEKHDLDAQMAWMIEYLQTATRARYDLDEGMLASLIGYMLTMERIDPEDKQDLMKHMWATLMKYERTAMGIIDHIAEI